MLWITLLTKRFFGQATAAISSPNNHAPRCLSHDIRWVGSKSAIYEPTPGRYCQNTAKSAGSIRTLPLGSFRPLRSPRRIHNRTVKTGTPSHSETSAVAISVLRARSWSMMSTPYKYGEVSGFCYLIRLALIRSRTAGSLSEDTCK